MHAEAIGREDIQQAALANSYEDFKLVAEPELDGLFIDRMEGNEDIFRRVMEDERFREAVADHIVRAVYRQIRSGKAT